jgi:hypothetical protein
MLEKSKKSAFIMGCIFILCAFISLTVVKMMSGVGESDFVDIFKSGDESQYVFIGWVFLVSVFLIGAGITALFVYRNNGNHYGVVGALRWGFTGLISGIAMGGVSQLLGSVKPSSYQEFAEGFLQILVVIVSYLAVFKLIPWYRKMHQTSEGEGIETLDGKL